MFQNFQNGFYRRTFFTNRPTLWPGAGMYPIEARDTPADAKTKQELREGIQIIHAELEASGSLDANATAEAAG